MAGGLRLPAGIPFAKNRLSRSLRWGRPAGTLAKAGRMQKVQRLEGVGGAGHKRSPPSSSRRLLLQPWPRAREPSATVLGGSSRGAHPGRGGSRSPKPATSIHRERRQRGKIGAESRRDGYTWEAGGRDADIIQEGKSGAERRWESHYGRKESREWIREWEGWETALEA